MVRGLPLVGSLFDFLREHTGLFQRAYSEHGPIFGIKLGPQRGVMLIGPQYHDFFFKEVDHRLSVPELYKFVIPMFGEVLVAAKDREVRHRHMAVMHSAFQGRQLAAYTEVMAAETGLWLDSLGDAGSFDVWTAMEALSMNIAATTLMGSEVRARIGEFAPLLGDLARGMEFILPPNLPLPKFRRRDRARALLTEMIVPVLADRRERPGEHTDFLQTLVDHPEIGEDDDLLVGMALCTIFTGYITTAAQMSWSLVLLLQHEEYLRSVVAEIDREKAPGSAEAAGTLPARARLPRLEWAVKEALRLRPVMSHYARYNTEEYELDGYRIPKGWLTMLCPAVAHRLPEVFTDPDRYDPERFAPGRAEDKRHPYAMIGFSGGFYRCPGSAFGSNEIKVALARLLDRYDLALGTPDPQASFDMGVIRPGSPCEVRYLSRVRQPESESAEPAPRS